VRLKEAAYAAKKTVYALKEGFLHDYLLKEQLTPKIAFFFTMQLFP
jgi:hypothetical protein